MRKRAYRATAVKDVKVAEVIQRLAEGRVFVGLDISKGEVLAVGRDIAGHFERPWKAKQPSEVRELVELIRQGPGPRHPRFEYDSNAALGVGWAICGKRDRSRAAGRAMTVGNIVGQVSFTSNDVNEATFNFALTGIPSPVQNTPPFGYRSLNDPQEIGTEPQIRLFPWVLSRNRWTKLLKDWRFASLRAEAPTLGMMLGEITGQANSEKDTH